MSWNGGMVLDDNTLHKSGWSLQSTRQDYSLDTTLECQLPLLANSAIPASA